MATRMVRRSDETGYAANQSFFVQLAWICAAIIVIGFVQNAALGRVAIPLVPIWVHLHGLLMLAWLGLLITQNRLAASGALARHRQLGRIGAGLVGAIVLIAGYSSIMALVLHRYPPFFTPAYFLALGIGEAGSFAGLVVAGIARRADTETHRRLISGSLLVLLEPALGRLLPMPLIGGETGQWVILAIQLGFVVAIAREDRRSRGRVLPATLAVGATLIATHTLVSLGARLPLLESWAAQLVAP
jgi:hypothetical protein